MSQPFPIPTPGIHGLLMKSTPGYKKSGLYFVIIYIFSFCSLIHLDFLFVEPGKRKGCNFISLSPYFCAFSFTFSLTLSCNYFLTIILYFLMLLKMPFCTCFLWSHNIPLYNSVINYFTSAIILTVQVVYCIFSL